MTWFRSVLYVTTMYLTTLVLFILCLPLLLTTRRIASYFPRFWSWYNVKLLALICGIHIQVIGKENLPKENGYIVASKHQSAMETLLFHSVIPDLFYVLKRELCLIPFAGFYFLKTGCIPIDRGGGAKTMRKMLAGVQTRLKEKWNLLIFPEGTRTAPGTKKPYSPGVCFLYEQCKVPVVPVALNTGYCWPKNKTKKNPGTVTVHILPTIEPGLDKKVFMKELTNRIETAQDELPHPFKEHVCK